MVRVRVRLKNRISKFLAVYRGCLVNVWGKCSTPSLAATNSAIARYMCPQCFSQTSASVRALAETICVMIISDGHLTTSIVVNYVVKK